MLAYPSPRFLPPLFFVLIGSSACADDGASSKQPLEETDSGAGTTSSPNGSSETASPTNGSDASTPGTAPDSGAETPSGSGDAGEPDADTDTGTVPNPTGDAGTAPDDDAGTGTGGDAAPLPDGGDGGPGTPWSGCPSADSVPHDAEWPLRLTVSDEAVYCATFNDTRTLKEELAAKLQLRVTPGEYRLPAQDHPSYALPVCLRQQAGAPHTASEGQLEYQRDSLGDATEHQVAAQLLFDQLGQLRVRMQRTVDGEQPPVFQLDGTENDVADDVSYASLELCSEPGQECFADRLFTSCDYSSGELNLHDVTLNNGQIRFELRLGESFAGTEPGAYVRASGTFEGVAFEQTDYFKLVYHPTHHHFERTFVVLFDAPIAGACGVEVHALEKFGNEVPDEAFTVDCELNRLEKLEVQAHQLTLE